MSEQDNLQNADGKEENTDQLESRNTVESQQENNNENAVNETDVDDVLNEIDASNAEDAEDVDNSERHSIELKDYPELSLDELVIELENLLKNHKVQAIKTQVEGIKSEFNDQFNTLLEEKKEEFISQGGNIIDFKYSTPIKRAFNDAYKEYRSRTSAYYNGLEKNLKTNLSTRLEIIEEIKALTDDAETSMNSKYKAFKDLQDRWKTAGPIPRDKYNNAWNSYHFNVERFYELLHLDRDLRDKDFEHNLIQKIKIIDRAEELATDDNTNRSFRELQVLHKLWKEDLGPVAKEHRDLIWDRFKQATKVINDKRQAYYDKQDEVYEKNLVEKEEIITKIEALSTQEVKSHSEWQNKIKEVEVLRNAFFKAGKVPIKVNEATWTKFKEAVRAFNRNKNAFYKSLKKDQFDNLSQKQALIKIAEDNKDTEDFDTVTPLMKKIQGDWKRIGHVPRKDSDKIWKQFKAACNHYFDRVHHLRNAASAEEEQALTEKEALLNEVKNVELKGIQKEDLTTITGYISQWKNIGRVPGKKRKIENDFNAVLDGLFNHLDMNKKEVEMLKFENKLQDLSSAEDSRFLDNERSFIRKKVDEIKSEIIQLENNLQFFNNPDKTNPLVKSVYDNIKKQKDALEIWKSKLRKIKDLY
ncbi:DUF349 domain-containing protein [Bizionia gelidisalsuginis]|uniref:DUF349 domain-containing protein n=2 Tax=Bizionia TaxID=283785 RepID=A0A8H2QKM1_9FLAO|nr:MULTISPECIES: DUF349 domain-containing protein [Bizionia]TYB80240.1 DUF349 domain-containing protein [Bizionia saleffrena]TYC17083.1 DUF349 domain-containing protein [Bizionia gelidisalsuginis]